MKRSTRIWIGAAAAVATFASLVGIFGMRHQHYYGMHHHRQCYEQCDDGWNHEHHNKAAAPAPEKPADTNPGK